MDRILFFTLASIIALLLSSSSALVFTFAQVATTTTSANSSSSATTTPSPQQRASPSSSSCPPEFWGPECTELCMCRQALSTTTNVSLWPLRGTCDRFTGVCSCFADPTQGFWSGATCGECLDGYIGSSCRLQSVAMAQFSPIQYGGKMITYTASDFGLVTSTTTTTATSTTTASSATTTISSTTAAAITSTTVSSTSSPSPQQQQPPTIQQASVAQPRHWLPFMFIDQNYAVLSGNALVVIDQNEPNDPPIALDTAETLSIDPTTTSSSSSASMSCRRSRNIFPAWHSARNGRLFVALMPSECEPNKIFIRSTYTPAQIRFLAVPVARPGTVRNILITEGFTHLNQTYETVLSPHHACWVNDWLQFCSIFYQWNHVTRQLYDNPSPWNLRCVPIPHRNPQNPGAPPTNPERVVASVWLDDSLQDLRGMVYWPAVDGVFVFGSKMTEEQQTASFSTSSKSSSSSTTGSGSSGDDGMNVYRQIHGVNSSACFLSIMWRNLSVTTFDLPGPDHLRRSCVALEKIVLINEEFAMISAIFETFSGSLILRSNSTHPIPFFVDFVQSSVPTDYRATAAAYGNRGVLAVSHCNKEAFTLYAQSSSLASTTLSSSSSSSTSSSSSSASGTNSSSTSSSSCLLTRFNFNTRELLSLVVTQVATDSDLPLTALAFSRDQNSILATVSRSPNGILVRRYLGWAILKAVPSLADVRGGTPITIFGSGFNPPQSSQFKDQLLCSFQPQGVSISPTQIYRREVLNPRDSVLNQMTTSTNFPSTTTTMIVDNSSSSTTIAPTNGDNSNTDDPQQFSSDTVFVPATYLSDRSLLCPAAAVTRTSATCSNVDNVDVSIIGSYFTGFGSPVFRFSQPVILSTNPQSIFANGQSTVPITMIGNGFSSSSVIKCRFFSNSSGELITTGTFVSSLAVLCESPKRTIPLSPDSTIDIANDGFHYTGRPVPFRMFGRPSSLAFTSSSLTVVDRNDYRLDSLTVLSVDAAGNPTSEGLGILPVLIRSIPKLCTIANPCTETDVLFLVNGTIPETSENRLGGNRGAALITGSATFSGLELTSKTATGYNGTFQNYVLLVAFIPSNQWYATTKMYIDTGVPVALVIVRAPASTVSDQGDMAATPAVSAIDSGGNVVVNGVESFEVQADVLQDPLPAGVELIEVEPIENRPRFAIFSNGVAEFLQVPVFARHGLTYRIRFSVRGVSTIQTVVSGPISSYCPPGSFKLPGLYTCSTCVPHAFCDGDNVSVLPGYWRSSELSVAIAECPTPVACPGGPVPGVCAPNYRGPRCDLCEPEFGRGITGECDSCPHPAVSGFVMLIIVIGLTTILTLLVVYVVQNSDRPMPRVVVLQQLVTHMQTLAIVAGLDNPWPQYFTKLAQWIDAVAGFRIMDTSFGECLISAYDLDFTGKFFFQLVLLGEIFLCIATAKAVLFIRPNFLKSQGLTGNTLKEKGMRRVPLKITTLRIVVPSILCGLFFLHQGTLMYAFGVLDCIEIDLGNGKTESVLLVDPSISCSGSTYRGISFISYPIIVIMGVLVPLGMFLAYLLHRFFRKSEKNLRYQLGAVLLSGVTTSSWWWPIMIFVRKGIMVLIVTLLKWPFDAFFLQAAFVLYLILLRYVQPYFDSHFLLIDQFGVVINILVINIGTMYHSTRNDGLHKAIAPIVIVLELIATIAFSLLISNRWRKWVFVQLKLEQKELERETEENYLQLHEIIRDEDVAGYVDHEDGGFDEEMIPLQRIEGGGIDEGLLKKRKKAMPRFVGDDDDDDDNEHNNHDDEDGSGTTNSDENQQQHRNSKRNGYTAATPSSSVVYDEYGRVVASEDDQIRSISDMPDKRSTSADIIRRKLGLASTPYSNRNGNNTNNSKNKNHTFSSDDRFNNKNAPPIRNPQQQKTSLAKHNPLLTSKTVVANFTERELEEESKKTSNTMDHLLAHEKLGNKSTTEYVPKPVPLPQAENKLAYKRELQNLRLAQAREAEEQRRRKREEIERKRQELLNEEINGPKVVRSESTMPKKKTFSFGFEQYRQELAEQAEARATHIHQIQDHDDDDENDYEDHYYDHDSDFDDQDEQQQQNDSKDEQEEIDSDEELIRKKIYGMRGGKREREMLGQKTAYSKNNNNNNPWTKFNQQDDNNNKKMTTRKSPSDYYDHRSPSASSSSAAAAAATTSTSSRSTSPSSSNTRRRWKGRFDDIDTSFV